jgi:hypothetical protein
MPNSETIIIMNYWGGSGGCGRESGRGGEDKGEESED